jgi:hypothetical protein
MKMRLARDAKVVSATFSVIVITALLWRLLYQLGDVGLLGILPLALLMFVGCHQTILGSRRASLDSILSETTSVRNWLKGRVISAVLSLGITIFGVFLFTYKVLVAQPWEILAGLSCVLVTTMVMIRAFRWVKPHVNSKYLLTAASSVTVVFVGTVFFFIYIYGLWNFQAVPGYFLNESLLGSIERSLFELPQGHGYGAGLLEIAVAIDAAKTWAVFNAQYIAGYVPMIYVIYGALFGYFQVRVVAAVVSVLIMTLNGENEDREGFVGE